MSYDPQLTALLAPLLDDRFYPDVPPDNPQYPCAVYQQVGGREPIHVVSAYRSPKTNSMLRAKSSGVAENSQHMRGKAMAMICPAAPS